VIPDGLFAQRKVEEGLAMANEEHLARLKRGVKAWNRWRSAHPEIQPDLRQAKLYTADLPKANFSYTDLSGPEIWD
jgi:uncharacterized protein YjbI with pentapeptide repeats